MNERKALLLRFPGADHGEFKVLVDTVNGDFADFRHLPVLPPVPMAIFMAAAFDPMSWKNSLASRRGAKTSSTGGGSSGYGT
jgi:hypothetical protein